MYTTGDRQQTEEGKGHEKQQARRVEVSSPEQNGEGLLEEIRKMTRTLGDQIATANKELADKMTAIEKELGIIAATMARQTDLIEAKEDIKNTNTRLDELEKRMAWDRTAMITWLALITSGMITLLTKAFGVFD